MRYQVRTNIKDLQMKYDYLVGWGNSSIEFERRYNPTMYTLKYLVNGRGAHIGRVCCGNVIQPPNVLNTIKDKKVCVIIYTNTEEEIISQIHEIIPEADTIVGRLVSIDTCDNSYSRDNEDRIMLNLVTKMNMGDFTYMDIGVCHPVVRNNTYLFYEAGHYNGVLVEPNPTMVSLIEEYRPQNHIVNFGASPAEEGSLTYYYGNTPGLNTFSEKLAEERGIQNNKVVIPVININKIIEENFVTCPDILDIDTEGMDYELLSSLDFNHFQIKIICVEVGDNKNIKTLLEKKGYYHYTSTDENYIFIRNDELIKLQRNIR